MAFEKQGEKASVAVLRYGGHVLPIVDDEAVRANVARRISSGAILTWMHGTIP